MLAIFYVSICRGYFDSFHTILYLVSLFWFELHSFAMIWIFSAECVWQLIFDHTEISDVKISKRFYSHRKRDVWNKWRVTIICSYYHLLYWACKSCKAFWFITWFHRWEIHEIIWKKNEVIVLRNDIMACKYDRQRQSRRRSYCDLFQHHSSCQQLHEEYNDMPYHIA